MFATSYHSELVLSVQKWFREIHDSSLGKEINRLQFCNLPPINLEIMLQHLSAS